MAFNKPTFEQPAIPSTRKQVLRDGKEPDEGREWLEVCSSKYWETGKNRGTKGRGGGQWAAATAPGVANSLLLGALAVAIE